MVGRILPPPDLPSERWAARNPSHPGMRPLTVRPGRHHAVEFILPRGAVIAGQVLTLAETPIQNAPVDVLEIYDESHDARTFSGAGSSKTDINGYFRVEGLRSGTYFVRADLGEGSVPVFYPYESSPKKASAITVNGPEMKSVRVTSLGVSPVPIFGRVLDEDGKPFRGKLYERDGLTRSTVEVLLRRLDEDCCSDVTLDLIINVDEAGRFRTHPLSPGKYILRVGRHVVPVVVESMPLEDIVVQLRRPAAVKGRVVPEGHPGVIGNQPYIRLRPATGVPSQAQGHAAEDGTFSLDVAPGSYRFEITPADGWAAEGVFLDDGRNVIDALVELQPGEVLERVRIALTNRVGRIEGTVFPADMLGTRGYTVIAYPEARDHWHENSRFIRRASTGDKDGTFVLDALLPGMVYLVAVHPWGSREPSVSLSAWLEELAPAAVRVAVPEPGTYRAEINLERKQ